MRLARFAAAGLLAGIAAGFAVALLRPRARPGLEDHETPSTGNSIDVTGPVGWGARPEQPRTADVRGATSDTTEGTR